MDENDMLPEDTDTWIKQVAVYFHDAGWVLGVGLMLGIKYIFWGWISKLWSSLARTIHNAITNRKLEISDDDDGDETDRERRIRLERDKDRDDFRDFMDELNKRAIAEINRLELKLKGVESERDHKDRELSEIRSRYEKLENHEVELRHAVRNARAVADSLSEKLNLAPTQWKDIP